MRDPTRICEVLNRVIEKAMLSRGLQGSGVTFGYSEVTRFGGGGYRIVVRLLMEHDMVFSQNKGTPI